MSRRLVEFLSEGLQLWVDKGELRFRAAKGKLTPDLRARLVTAKPELLEELDEGVRYGAVSLDQERLWYLDQLQPGRAVYNMPMAYRLRGDLDVAALERSLNRVVERHDSLRTSFGSVEGIPYQITRPSMNLELPVVDLTHLSGSDGQDELKNRLHEVAALPFDLGHPPMVRGIVVKVTGQEHVIANKG